MDYKVCSQSSIIQIGLSLFSTPITPDLSLSSGHMLTRNETDTIRAFTYFSLLQVGFILKTSLLRRILC